MAPVLLPAALFFAGLLAFVGAKRSEASATKRHDHNWISRKSNAGWGGSSGVAGARRRQSNESKPLPKVGGEGGLPRWARPYEGGSATASAGVRIGDDLPRDWFQDREVRRRDSA